MLNQEIIRLVKLINMFKKSSKREGNQSRPIQFHPTLHLISLGRLDSYKFNERLEKIFKNTHLKNLKAIDIQYSNVQLLMVLNHGFID